MRKYFPTQELLVLKERGIVVKGIPTKAGDYEITLKYKYQNWSEGYSILERKFKVAVNPDPRSLWKTFRQTRTSNFSRRTIHTNT